MAVRGVPQARVVRGVAARDQEHRPGAAPSGRCSRRRRRSRRSRRGTRAATPGGRGRSRRARPLSAPVSRARRRARRARRPQSPRARATRVGVRDMSAQPTPVRGYAPRVALEVGIVGLPGAGKTTLFTALTKAGGGEYGKTNVGMAQIADERLDALAKVVSARKITPAAIRVAGRAGHGPGAARQPAPGRRAARRARRLLAGRRPGARSREPPARAARRRPRPRRAAARAGREAGEVGRREAARGGRGARQGARARRRGGAARRTTRASCRRSSSR